MKQKIFTYITWKEGKHFVAQCLNVDVSSFGETHEKAVENLDEAVELYLEDAKNEDIQSIHMASVVMSHHA